MNVKTSFEKMKLQLCFFFKDLSSDTFLLLLLLLLLVVVVVVVLVLSS